MKLLIIDNESETIEVLHDVLAAEGYHVETASSGEQGLQAARAGGIDLVLLDVALPKRDGFSVLESLRKAGNDTPVIFLTGRDSLEDRVRGLSLGSDDYVIKPFEPAELVARIKSVLRRTRRPRRKRPEIRRPAQPSHRRPGTGLDPQPRRASRPATQAHAQGIRSTVPAARQHGQVLSRPAIAEQIWDSRLNAGTNVVDVHVRRLRAKWTTPSTTRWSTPSAEWDTCWTTKTRRKREWRMKNGE